MILAEGIHPAPSRTRQLSPPALMVLGARAPGRVGHCLGSLFLCVWRCSLFRRHLFALAPLFLLTLVLLCSAYAPLLSRNVVLDVGSPDDTKYVLSGLYNRENVHASPYRWSSGDAVLLFPNRGLVPLTISLALDAPRPEGVPQPEVAVSVNGREDRAVRRGGGDQGLYVPACSDETISSRPHREGGQ